MIIRIVDGRVLTSNIPVDDEDIFLNKNTGLGYRKVNALPPSDYGFWKLDESGEIVADEERNAEQLRGKRYKRLEQIFTQKVLGLKKLAIDKPWMNNAESINDQYRVYEEMYKNAKNGYYAAEQNAEIIAINEATKEKLAGVTLLLNEIRSFIEKQIEDNNPQADIFMDKAERITLSGEDITPEKISEIKSIFWKENL